MAALLVLLVTSPRVATGLLSLDAWDALRAGPVMGDDVAAPLLEPLRAAGIAVALLDPQQSAREKAERLRLAAGDGTASWLAGPGEDPVGRAVATLASERSDVSVEVLHGSWDLPGSRLLDVVAVMDRLRSPGGCPWDAEQTHASLAPHLLEEAYEAVQAIDDDDPAALREEIGDVLLQVAFHARLAEEAPEDRRFTVDDVAGDLVAKLVRRHPHVFADGAAVDASSVEADWETIKTAERGSRSTLAGVPRASPALSQAAALQRRAARAGLVDPADTGASWDSALSAYESGPGEDTAAELLWQLVALLRAADVDAEAVLRRRSAAFRARLGDG